MAECRSTPLEEGSGPQINLWWLRKIKPEVKMLMCMGIKREIIRDYWRLKQNNNMEVQLGILIALETGILIALE